MLAYAGRAGATAWRTAAPRREERRGPVTMRTEWHEPAQDICRFDPDAPGGEYCDDYHVPATTTDPRLRFRNAVSVAEGVPMYVMILRLCAALG